MEYKEYITEDMQKIWFDSIDNINNFFFIVEYNGTPLGLINTSHIDWANGVADTGLFVWDEIYLNSHIPVLASLGMLDVFFTVFGLKKVTAKVKNDNIKAIEYNVSLGYKLVEKYKNSDFSLYELDKENYYCHAASLRKSALTLYGNKTEIFLNSKNKPASKILEIINKASEKNKQALNLLLHHN